MWKHEASIKHLTINQIIFGKPVNQKVLKHT